MAKRTIIPGSEADRCPVCGWTLAATRSEGCVPGDCSYRPAEGTPEWNRVQANRAALANEVP
ncbi:hypothetical protein [Longimicrobium sp.]|jgi:hypothetical protein|uniref:hypothetical protein n=1 Tax=Longimicrobium sp. TaxID=2029185 RepID=UPI002F91D672